MLSFSTVAVFAFMLALIGGINVYLACRVHQCIRALVPQASVGYAIAFFLLMAVVMIVGFARSMIPMPAVLRNALGVVSAYWMGIFVYLLLYMVLAEAVYLVLRCFLPGAQLRAWTVLAAVVLTITTSAYGIWHANHQRHVTYDVDVSSAQETRLVLISDLHLGAVGSERRLEKIVEEINAQQPDVVCIAGDFFDNDFNAIRSPEKAAQTLQKLQTTYGVYVCPGNHDSGSTVPQMLRFWEECGIRLLADEYVVIDDRLVLAGRRDSSPIGGFDGQRRETLDAVLANAPAGLPVIVMDHNPIGASSYGEGVSLVLSGHTHKGQIFPGSLITNAMYDVDHGSWRKDDISPYVIVSSGVGTWGPPMRVGTDSEIVTVNLR